MASVEHVVGAEHTAAAVGSGDLEVLGTPVVVAWCEEATCATLDLPGHLTSVGTRVEIEHLAPSAVGATVTCSATIEHQDERRARFGVEVVDQAGLTVARGTIERAVVDRERFRARVLGVED